MDVASISKEELKNFDLVKLRETESDIRRELALLRMDLYGDKRQMGSKVISLKKSLARVLTFRTVLLQSQSKKGVKK